MKTFIFYILQVGLASGVLYVYYHFFLRNSKFHQYNRFYLLAATIVSLIVPLLHIDIYFTSRQDIPVVYQLLAGVRAGNADDPGATPSFFSWEKIVELSYCLVAMLFLVRLGMSLMWIRRLRMNHQSEKLKNITFINTHEKGTPFSFFRWLFWNKKISIESPGGQIIFRHELFHIQQKHSWDIIYLELLTTLCWFNPFFHLIKKETKAIHEFLADQFAASQNNKWDYAELLVMQTLQTRQRIVNPFFHNQIKRRIAMITNSSKTSYQYLRKVMVLPVTFFIVTVIAVNCTSKDVNDVRTDTNNQKSEYLKQKINELQESGNKSASDSQMALYLKQIKEKLIADNKIFSEVEITPSFIDGETGWRTFLQKNLNANVPVDNGAPEGTYKVMTQFIVDRNGKISDIKTLTNFGFGMEEEVLRVMNLSPDWSPAMQNGHVVSAYRKQPITFVISAE